jgi:hypothetical protein
MPRDDRRFARRERKGGVRVPPPVADRRTLLAKVHIARKQLALTEESYRDLLRRVTGFDSAGDCADGALTAVLEEFARLGFKPSRPKSAKPYVRLIYALWGELKPYLSNSSDEALRGFVFRQSGAQAPEWLGPEKANKVIEGLKAWLARERAKEAAHV